MSDDDIVLILLIFGGFFALGLAAWLIEFLAGAGYNFFEYLFRGKPKPVERCEPDLDTRIASTQKSIDYYKEEILSLNPHYEGNEGRILMYNTMIAMSEEKLSVLVKQREEREEREQEESDDEETWSVENMWANLYESLYETGIAVASGITLGWLVFIALIVILGEEIAPVIVLFTIMGLLGFAVYLIATKEEEF